VKSAARSKQRADDQLVTTDDRPEQPAHLSARNPQEEPLNVAARRRPLQCSGQPLETDDYVHRTRPPEKAAKGLAYSAFDAVAIHCPRGHTLPDNQT
jgi:hypothetical protein